MSGGALDGIRVLEFSQIIAGPVVGISLSDLGADVVKVEQPGGEPLRASGSVVPGESKAFQSYNRGKRGIVLDLHDPRGLQTAYRLIPHMDVVVTNYRPGVVQRLGIDYETLRELRDDLIYLEATGFGTTGPEAHQGGNDGVIRAYSGISGGDGQADEHGAPIYHRRLADRRLLDGDRGRDGRLRGALPPRAHGPGPVQSAPRCCAPRSSSRATR